MIRWGVLLLLAGCNQAIQNGYDRDRDGFVAAELDGPDCDDSNPDVHPGQDELCGNGVDDNCDGAIDDAGVGQVVWYEDLDGDDFPGAEAHVGCVAPVTAFTDLSGGVDCDDTQAHIHPGASEAWYDGVDGDCDGADDFDADGDGYRAAGEVDGGDDCDDTREDVNPGSIEVCNNGVDDDCDGGPNDCLYSGEYEIGEIAEITVEGTGADFEIADLTGDGVPDLITHLLIRGEGEEHSELRVIAGPLDGALDDVVATVTMPADVRLDAWSAGGDGNGDGQVDLLLGARSENTVWVLYGPLAGSLTPAHAEAAIVASLVGGSSPRFGDQVAWLEDVNGDLRDEILATSGRAVASDREQGFGVFISPHASQGAASAAALWTTGSYTTVRTAPAARGRIVLSRFENVRYHISGAAVGGGPGAYRLDVITYSPTLPEPGFGFRLTGPAAPLPPAVAFVADDAATAELLDASSGESLAVVAAELRVGERAYTISPDATACDLDDDGLPELVMRVGRVRGEGGSAEILADAFEVYGPVLDGDHAAPLLAAFSLPTRNLTVADLSCAPLPDGRPALVIAHGTRTWVLPARRW